jgi:hypothetical protein
MKVVSNLPGLPTISALGAAILITVWLGVDGPIELEKLKEWQTLMAAIIAPSIAFLAAIVAYKAAMAKVNFDREVHEKTMQRHRRGLMLRLRFALEHNISQGAALLDTINLQSEKGGEVSVTPQTFAAISTPLELDEAWKDLGLFDALLTNKIAVIKTQFREIEIVRSQWPSDKKWTFKRPDFPEDLSLLAEIDTKLEEHCRNAIELLDERLAEAD